MLACFPSSSLIATSHRVEIARADAKTVPLRRAFHRHHGYLSRLSYKRE
jgi:hypothetical protein